MMNAMQLGLGATTWPFAAVHLYMKMLQNEWLLCFVYNYRLYNADAMIVIKLLI